MLEAQPNQEGAGQKRADQREISEKPSAVEKQPKQYGVAQQKVVN
jgi:hypothetical protein